MEALLEILIDIDYSIEERNDSGEEEEEIEAIGEDKTLHNFLGVWIKFDAKIQWGCRENLLFVNFFTYDKPHPTPGPSPLREGWEPLARLG